jgi:hypothetical protein
MHTALPGSYFDRLGVPRLAAHKPQRTEPPDADPKKLIDQLRRRYPSLAVPASSTAGAILKSEGLVQSRRRPRAPLTPAVWQRERTPADRSNRVWTI